MAMSKLREGPTDFEATWRNIAEVVGIGVQTLKECYYNATHDENKVLPEYLQK